MFPERGQENALVFSQGHPLSPDGFEFRIRQRQHQRLHQQLHHHQMGPPPAVMGPGAYGMTASMAHQAQMLLGAAAGMGSPLALTHAQAQQMLAAAAATGEIRGSILGTMGSSAAAQHQAQQAAAALAGRAMQHQQHQHQQQQQYGHHLLQGVGMSMLPPPLAPFGTSLRPGSTLQHSGLGAGGSNGGGVGGGLSAQQPSGLVGLGGVRLSLGPPGAASHQGFGAAADSVATSSGGPGSVHGSDRTTAAGGWRESGASGGAGTTSGEDVDRDFI